MIDGAFWADAGALTGNNSRATGAAWQGFYQRRTYRTSLRYIMAKINLPL